MKPSRKTHDPAGAVALFRGKLDPSNPERGTIPRNLENSRKAVRYRDCGCGSPCLPNPESADWKPARDPVCKAGPTAVMLDVMSDLRIGSIGNLDLGAPGTRPIPGGPALPEARP